MTHVTHAKTGKFTYSLKYAKVKLGLVVKTDGGYRFEASRSELPQVLTSLTMADLKEKN